MEELRDAKGRTEKEFLAAYKPGNYERPSLTADIAVFASEGDTLRLLLIRRGGHPYLGRWALPGGFANKNERVEETAARELEEETGLTGLKLGPVGFFSAPNRDPRMWVVSHAFTAVIPPERVGEIQAGDDAADARWFTLSVKNEDGEVRIGFEASGVSFAVRLTVERTAVTPTLESVKVTVLENGGLAFDHGEIIGRALCCLGVL